MLRYPGELGRLVFGVNFNILPYLCKQETLQQDCMVFTGQVIKSLEIQILPGIF